MSLDTAEETQFKYFYGYFISTHRKKFAMFHFPIHVIAKQLLHVDQCYQQSSKPYSWSEKECPINKEVFTEGTKILIPFPGSLQT